jgi:hypothetical protein
VKVVHQAHARHLVKGSATLDVTKIATAKVGNASPVVSGVSVLSSRPTSRATVARIVSTSSGPVRPD